MWHASAWSGNWTRFKTQPTSGFPEPSKDRIYTFKSFVYLRTNFCARQHNFPGHKYQQHNFRFHHAVYQSGKKFWFVTIRKQMLTFSLPQKTVYNSDEYYRVFSWRLTSDVFNRHTGSNQVIVWGGRRERNEEDGTFNLSPLCPPWFRLLHHTQIQMTSLKSEFERNVPQDFFVFSGRKLWSQPWH